MALVNKFSFQRGPQAFGHGIVVGIADGSHRLGNPELLAEEPVVQTRVLAAMIGVEDGAGESVAAPGEGSGPKGVALTPTTSVWGVGSGARNRLARKPERQAFAESEFADPAGPE